MKEYISKKLNIPGLLALGDLDVRRIAADNENITAHEYFSMVEWLIEDTPHYTQVLILASNVNDIVNIGNVLRKIGYDKLTECIDCIVHNIREGNSAEARKYGAQAAGVLNTLYGRLKSMYTAKSRRYVIVRAERFIEKAPLWLKELARVSDQSRLEEIKGILSAMGYEKPDSNLGALVEQIRVEQLGSIAMQNAEILAKINDYYIRFCEAYKDINREYAQSAEETGTGILLKEALEYWDFKERHRKLRILAVDDVPAVLNSVVSILSPHYEVFALTKASQVEKFLFHTTPELFLLDIEMPELSGYDLVSVIRSFSEHKNTPIIFLTGRATMENIKTAVVLGACDFITKPVDRDVLLQKIESKIVWKKSF